MLTLLYVLIANLLHHLLLTNHIYNTIALAAALFAEMNTLAMPSIGNHTSSQVMPEKKMTPPDSKNSAANFASAFKNKVILSKYKNLFKHYHNVNKII
jgi:hypothetical protein